MGNKQTKEKQRQAEQTDVPWAWVKRVQEITDPTTNSASTNMDVLLPVEILSWLLLSDEKNARDVAKLKRLGVTHVLSVNGTTPHEAKRAKESWEAAGIIHLRVSGEDSEGYNMIGNHWKQCREFIKNARATNHGRILVHCVAGINRSGLIACAAHMHFEQETVLTVVQHSVQCRGKVVLNRSFQQQLCLLAAKEGLLGIKPPGLNDAPIVQVRPPSREAHEALHKLF